MTNPTRVMPDFYLESKHADIQASRGDDVHYSWVVGDGQLLTVEYIPDNWPCLTVSIAKQTVAKMKATLQEIGFEVDGKRGVSPLDW